MDFITSTAILPLLFGCVGIFSLFKLLQHMRMKAYLRNAVVIITGANSGLGRGKSWRQCCGGGGGRKVGPRLEEQLRCTGTTSTGENKGNRLGDLGIRVFTVLGPAGKSESLSALSAMRHGP